MSLFLLDRLGLVFCLIALGLFAWAALDTQRFLKVLSYGRRSSFPRWALLCVRAPAAVVAVGAGLLVLTTVLYRIMIFVRR